MSPLFKFRFVLGFFIVALVLSGVTAFPLQTELEWLAALLRHFNVPADSGLSIWIHHVRDGLTDSYQRYPWIAYGTDWLAFAHLIIAIFFIGPFLDPLSNRWVLISGMIACVLVFPLALICGPIRGIPFYWRLIDCSFGILGILPLWYCLHLRSRIAAAAGPG